MATWIAFVWLVGMSGVPGAAFGQMSEARGEVSMVFPDTADPSSYRYRIPDKCTELLTLILFRPGGELDALRLATSRARVELGRQGFDRVGIRSLTFHVFDELQTQPTLRFIACGWRSTEVAGHRAVTEDDLVALAGLFRLIFTKEAGPAMLYYARQWCRCKSPLLQLHAIVIEPAANRVRVKFKARWHQESDDSEKTTQAAPTSVRPLYCVAAWFCHAP